MPLPDLAKYTVDYVRMYYTGKSSFTQQTLFLIEYFKL